MKKEEFIIYLEGIASVLEAAGLDKLEAVIDDIIFEAGTIEINISYPYYQYHYPYRPYRPYTSDPFWYTTTVSDNTAGDTTTTTNIDYNIGGPASTTTVNWKVNYLPNGDFEIVKN